MADHFAIRGMYYNGVHQIAVMLYPKFWQSKKDFVQGAAKQIEANSPAMANRCRSIGDRSGDKRAYLLELLKGIFDQLESSRS